MDKDELIKLSNATLRELSVVKKKLAGRKPKIEKAARELNKAREEAKNKVEEDYKRRNAKLVAEINELEEKVRLLSKRYLELSGDIVRVPETPFPSQARSDVTTS
jgi:uncharacterized phage infection (PIP) family protein YhgE